MKGRKIISEKLSIKEKIGYSLGDLAANLVFQTLMTYLAYFYTDIYGLTEGIDRFTETWNLVKLRLNRGTYFKSKYQLAFDTLEMIKLQK